jgi:hypothetical protein
VWVIDFGHHPTRLDSAQTYLANNMPRTKESTKKPVSRSRKRDAAAVEEPVHGNEPRQMGGEAEQEQAAPQPTAAAARTDRRDQMAEIAQRCRTPTPSACVCSVKLYVICMLRCRRAAHFATFRTEDDEDADVDNVHVGGDEVRTFVYTWRA